jgi:predicted small metal-binding protein
MGRKYVDCREVPSESGCTLAIVGEPDEVVSAAVAHMKTVHAHDETDAELAEMVRGELKDAPAPLA